MKNKRSTLQRLNNGVVGFFCGVLIVCFLWMAITSTIARFVNPELTETQLFLNIPKSFMLHFK